MGIKRGVIDSHILELFMLVTILTLMLAGYATAFGVSTPYLENDTLKLEPGQHYTYTVNLQNNDDILFDVAFNYTADKDIAQLISGNTTLRPKTYNNPFVFEIIAPDDAIKGERYTLQFSARPLLNLSGQVPMVVQIQRSLTVLIVDKNGQGQTLTLYEKMRIWERRHNAGFMIAVYVIVGLIILAVAFVIILRLWRISKGIAGALEPSTKIEEGPPARMTISACTSVEDITELIATIPENAFNLPEIRTLCAEKFMELNEKFLSQKVFTVKTKEDMLDILRK